MRGFLIRKQHNKKKKTKESELERKIEKISARQSDSVSGAAGKFDRPIDS